MRLLLIDTQNVYDAIRQIDRDSRLDYTKLLQMLDPLAAKIAFCKGKCDKPNPFACHLLDLNFQIIMRANPRFILDMTWFTAIIISAKPHYIFVTNSCAMIPIYKKIQSSKATFSIFGYNMPNVLKEKFGAIELECDLLITTDDIKTKKRGSRLMNQPTRLPFDATP